VIRYTLLMCGIHFGGVYDVPNSTLINMLEAVYHRVFVRNDGTRPPPPKKWALDLLDEFLKEFSKRTFLTTPLEPEDFVRLYEGAKFRLYSNALLQLQQFGLRSRDKLIHAFPKVEKLQVKGGAAKQPRAIFARSPVYNIVLGCLIKQLEGPIFKNINRMFGERTVMKGLNAVQIGEAIFRKWKRFPKPVCFKGDCSRFDMHCWRVVLDRVTKAFAMYLPRDSRTELYRVTVRNNKCVAFFEEGRLHWESENGLPSGCMSTAMAGVIIVCAILWLYRRHTGWDMSVADSSDDFIIICDETTMDKASGLPAFFEAFGFKLEFEAPVRQIEKIVFCQCSPVLFNGSYLMVRDPRLCVSKDLITTLQCDSEKQWRGIMKALGQGGLALYAGMPIWCEFYRMLLRMGGNAKAVEQERNGFWYLRRGVDFSLVEKIPWETRCSFETAFGFTPTFQKHYETFYKRLNVPYTPPRMGLKPHFESIFEVL